jgi:PAS domain S-box-containing protein
VLNLCRSGEAPSRNHSVTDLLHLAVDGLVDHALFTLDPQGVITFWNVRAEHLFGWTSEQAVRAHVASLLGSGGADGIGMADLEEAKRRGSVTATRQLKHQNGNPREARTTILALRSEAGVLGYGVTAHLTAMAERPFDVRDVEDRIDHTSSSDTRRQLSESKTLLAAEIADRRQAEVSRARLLRRLVVAQEDERRRLAQDLHDGLGQRLISVNG